MRVLNEVLPEDTTIVAGAGNPGIWTHLLEIPRTGHYIKPVGFGNMGFALPAAIAAKLVRPTQPVVSIIGDGSLGMCLAEIETAVREKTPVVIIVMNNLSYGNIKQEQLTHFGPRYIGVDFTDIRYVEVARGLGADGERVEDPVRLPGALRHAISTGRTWLLDVMVDPDENVWTQPF
jgi:acetolactate synthase-1/2/3 large subunit